MKFVSKLGVILKIYVFLLQPGRVVTLIKSNNPDVSRDENLEADPDISIRAVFFRKKIEFQNNLF